MNAWYDLLSKWAIVSAVTDGDTFETFDGRRIRLASVYAPERGKPGYESATQQLTNLIGNQSVQLEQVALSYDRIVANVWTIDGTFVNEEMQRILSIRRFSDLFRTLRFPPLRPL